MCKVPTTTSPIIIRLPLLQTFEGVAAGLRADVKQTASVRGHRMTNFIAGDSHCTACLMEVSVERLHPFTRVEKGFVYQGTALDNPCPGRPLSKDDILQRISTGNRPSKGART